MLVAVAMVAQACPGRPDVYGPIVVRNDRFEAVMVRLEIDGRPVDEQRFWVIPSSAVATLLNQRWTTRLRVLAFVRADPFVRTPCEPLGQVDVDTDKAILLVIPQSGSIQLSPGHVAPSTSATLKPDLLICP